MNSFRYLGFEQLRDRRLYRLERQGTVVLVGADLGLFAAHGVDIQDGPMLCARRLAAGPVPAGDRQIELTARDFSEHAAERALARERPAASRRRLRQRLPSRHPRSPLGIALGDQESQDQADSQRGPDRRLRRDRDESGLGFRHLHDTEWTGHESATASASEPAACAGVSPPRIRGKATYGDINRLMMEPVQRFGDKPSKWPEGRRH